MSPLQGQAGWPLAAAQGALGSVLPEQEVEPVTCGLAHEALLGGGQGTAASRDSGGWDPCSHAPESRVWVPCGRPSRAADGRLGRSSDGGQAAEWTLSCGWAWMWVQNVALPMVLVQVSLAVLAQVSPVCSDWFSRDCQLWVGRPGARPSRSFFMGLGQGTSSSQKSQSCGLSPGAPWGFPLVLVDPSPG